LREERQVDKESRICVNSSKYPVPQQYRHKTVEIYLTNESLIVLDPKTGEEIIAHRLCVFPGSTVVRPDREDRNQKKRDQLRLELFGMFESRDWKRFVIKNFKRFERYFRDQYHEAKAKFGKGIEPEPLERALKFCLETDTLSMAQLKDSYDYFKRELESQGSVVPFANRVQKSTLSDRNIKLPQVKTRGLSVYLDLIQNGTREVSA